MLHLRLFAAACGFVATLAQAQIGVSAPPRPAPAGVSCMNLELKKGVPCPDSNLFFQEGQAPVEDAFHRRDFAKLNALYGAWCTGKDRFPDGTWKLAQYKKALEGLFDAWNTWNADLGKIKAWESSFPNSEAAQYAEAVYWHAYAWKARGSGYASSVSKEGWELFHERLEKSRVILTTLRQRASQCPAPGTLLIAVLTDGGASEEALMPVFDEVTTKFPQYHNAYFAMARHYGPLWGGNAAQYEKFANRVAAQTRSFEGMGMYARLYWLVDDNNQLPFRNEPLHPPYWNKLKSGYEDLMRLYPNSIHNRGKYAGVACRSTDGALYRKLRTQIDGYEETVEMLDPVDVCDRRHHWSEASK